MAKPKDPPNPFYVLLVVVGLLFFVTGAAYFVMALRAVRGLDTFSPEPPSGLMLFMDAYGMQALLAEVSLLAVFTVAAISTDTYWLRRAERRRGAQCAVDRPTRNDASSD